MTGNYILFTDTHLTDSLIDEYRWNVFDSVEHLAKEHNVKNIFCLGDFSDRKDRHSGVLVNRVVDRFLKLTQSVGGMLFILAGNHDAPITGPYYWTFLNNTPSIKYITEPTFCPIPSGKGIYLFPFTSNPVKDWAGLDYRLADAVFMHQTISGALIEGDRILTSSTILPSIPKGIPIFSGDVHRPQKLGDLTYIGTPHPIKFSETWANRVILIKDDDFHHPIDIWLPSTRRSILDIHSTDDLKNLNLTTGDQVKIRYHLTNEKLSQYPIDEERIKTWGQETGIIICGLDPILEGSGLQVDSSEDAQLVPELLSNEQVLKLFSEQEKLDPKVIEMGLQCLQESN